MKTLMLAAGVGKRLYGEDDSQPPKALLRFDGKTLLHRHIEILEPCGIEELVLVVGYREEDIVAEVEAIGAGDYVRMVRNPDFRGGPMISLWAAREMLREGDDILFMDADVLYHPPLLERLIRSPQANCVLLDRDIQVGEDPVRVCVNAGAVVDFGKMIEGDFEMVGEWPGFMKMSPRIAAKVADMTQLYMDQGKSDMTYEWAMRDVLVGEPHGTFGYEDITGVPWIEIDFPADLMRAEKIILPRISLPGDGAEEAETMDLAESGSH